MIQHHAFSNQQHVALRIAPRLIFGAGMLWATNSVAQALTGTDPNFAVKLQQLTEAITQTQKQLEQSQRELEQLRSQLSVLQQQLAQTHVPEAQANAEQLTAAVEQIREQQTIQEMQIATHEQSKVESESKYPLKLSGLVLMTGFVNTTRMDNPVTPAIALEGSGSTGASLSQTVLGLDARGPHLFNARTHADLRVDFDGAGSATITNSSAYAGGGLVRLRTAHAALDWQNTQAFFSLDHAIVAPNTPTSLTAVALPALAWSGNLWTWNPQVGVAEEVPFSDAQRLRVQAALISVNNPPQIYNGSTTTISQITTPTTAEMSRWPGGEARFAFLSGAENTGLQLGIGGLFAPHQTGAGTRFNSWAGTLDYRIPLPGRLEFSGSGYAGQALGGFGGGAFKDYVFMANSALPPGYSFRTLDDFGGWAQLKERVNERLEFNAAFGTDQVPASQLRPYAGPNTNYYLNLARNRTYTGNVIYRPTAYLMLSMEYRHIQSSPVNEYTSTGDVIGIATGYRF